MEWDARPRPEPSAGRGLSTILDDDATFVELLMRKPDLLDPDIVLVGDARENDEDRGGKMALAWRRGGGPALVGVATGSGSEALLVEALAILARREAWPVERWDEEARAVWERAPEDMRSRMAARWGLPGDGPWGVSDWTRAAWGEEPAPGAPAIAIVATRIPAAVQAAVDWLSSGTPVAAFRIRWYGEAAGAGPSIERVAGSWAVPAPAAPAAADDPVAKEPAPLEPAATAEPSGVAAILAQLAERCHAAGGVAASAGAGWVRYDAARSVRAFPGAQWVDLQLVGIDEGTRVGLDYRFGVRLGGDPPPDAPPGSHLRLAGPELDARVGSLLDAWLAGEGVARPARPRRPRPSASRRPRNARSRTDPA